MRVCDPNSYEYTVPNDVLSRICLPLSMIVQTRLSSVADSRSPWEGKPRVLKFLSFSIGVPSDFPTRPYIENSDASITFVMPSATPDHRAQIWVKGFSRTHNKPLTTFELFRRLPAHGKNPARHMSPRSLPLIVMICLTDNICPDRLLPTQQRHH